MQCHREIRNLPGVGEGTQVLRHGVFCEVTAEACDSNLFSFDRALTEKNEGEDAKEKDRSKAKFFWGEWKSDESFETMDKEQAALLGLEFKEDTLKYMATRKKHAHGRLRRDISQGSKSEADPGGSPRQ